jgi:membrane-bound serine protease (ClpP class)
VALGPDGKTEATGEKTVAAVRSQMAALAERNNHPVGIALAMVDFDVELWEVSVDGVSRVLTLQELERLDEDAVKRLGVISPPGKLLSLTAGEALSYGLAAGLADDREALETQLGLAGGMVESSPSAADGLISFLTSAPVQIILILLGLLMIFLEIQSPGFGIPGVAAIIAFSVVFGSGAMLGRVGSLEIILFLLGLGLLAVELFITPGFGVVGISGILLIGLSLIFSMQDFVIPRFDWEWSLLGRNAVVVTLGLIAAITGIALIALFGPRLKIFNRLTLTTAITGTAGGVVEARDEGGEESPYGFLAGKTGKALSTLRPSGRIEIGGEVYSAEADGSFVEEGREIKVARLQGSRIIVRAM